MLIGDMMKSIKNAVDLQPESNSADISEYTIGTGITAETRTRYSGAALEPALKTFLDDWNAAWHETGNDFGARTLDLVKCCRRILDANGSGPHKRDSDADFAKRILSEHEWIKMEIERGEATNAARYAFNMGIIAARFEMKQRFEPDVEKSWKLDSRLREAAAKKNKERKQISDAQGALCQAKANEIWSRNYNRTKMSVAKMLCSKLSLDEKPDTISRKIVKPSKNDLLS
jgi:hypothetical protein